MGTVTDLQEARAKRQSSDLLFQLRQITQGAIRIDINDHRGSYMSAGEYVKAYPQYFEGIPKSILEEIAKGNRLTVIKFYPLYPGKACQVISSTLDKALPLAFFLAKAARPDVVLHNTLAEYNQAELLSELASVCRASVHLEINGFKEEKYWDFEAQKDVTGVITAEKYLADEKEIDERKFVKDGDDEPEISEEMVQEMIKLDLVISLRAYTLTPVGFISLDGTDLGHMLSSMLAYAKNDVKRHPVK